MVWTDAKYPATLVYLTRSERPALFAGERSDVGVDASMAAAADLLLRPVPANGPDESWSVMWASSLADADLGGFDAVGTMALPWTEELHGRSAPVWHRAPEAQQAAQ